MNGLRLVLIVTLMGALCVAAAGGPFSVSVRMHALPPGGGGRAAEKPDGLPAVAGRKGSATKGQPLLSVRVAVPAHHKLYADQFAVDVPAPARLVPVSVPAPESRDDPLGGGKALVFVNSFEAVYAVENSGADQLPVTVRWQGCDQSVCFLPARKTFLVSLKEIAATPDIGGPSTGAVPAASAPGSQSEATSAIGTPAIAWRALTNRFVFVGQRAGYLATRELLPFLEGAHRAEVAVPETPLERWRQSPLWFSVLILLIGGLALNLTPCVLPMIPINLAIIGAGAQAQSRRRGAGMGALYGSGMTMAYGILGLLVVLTGSKFGTLNASPWFNLGVALLFAVLALAMFDVYNIDLSRFQGRFGAIGTGGGILVIFGLGALAAVLSGACVAPVVLSVLLLAANLYADGHTAALLLPFVLGLGMALPWPLAGAGLAFLPKPGRWMQRVKQAFGVLILMTAAYYAYTGLTLWRQPEIKGSHEGWLDSLPEALAQADKESKPLFIDFWATWCKNCHVMDATTFRNAEVRRELDSFVKVKVQAEHPDEAPDRDMLDAFAVMGLPTYVILKPVASTQRRAPTSSVHSNDVKPD